MKFSLQGRVPVFSPPRILLVLALALPAATISAATFAEGADIGWLSQMEASGVKFYNAGGTHQDCLQVLRSVGINSIRLRVWVNPADGWCGQADVVAEAVRARSLGFRIMLDFHYSDSWADPGKQTKPATWSTHDITRLRADVATHTAAVLTALKSAGVSPEWVQVGNETNDGMLWEDGRASTNMGNFATLITSGCDAVKSVFPDAKVIVHLSNGWDNGLFRRIFDGLTANAAKYDVVGMSLYPTSTDWTTRNSQCLANMNDMVTRYGKEVMISEIGMDVTAVTACKTFIADLITKTKSLPGGKGLGVFYWEPESYNRWQGYTLGAFGNDGRPTAAMDAFAEAAQATTAPGIPPNLGAFASGATEATITWLAPSGGDAATGFRLERATNSGFTDALATINLTATSTSHVDPTIAADTTYFYRISAVNAVGASAPSSAVEMRTPAANGSGTASFANLATRAYCGTGNNVTIGGFVVSGIASKRVLIRAVGPSLTEQGIGVNEVLLDPTIEVHDAIHGNVVVATNDNLADNPNVTEISAVAHEIGAAALLSDDDKSSALLTTLTSGVYSFVVKGRNDTAGIVLLEVYDADAAPTGSAFANLASRAYCTTNNGVTIGGFVISGGARKHVLLRALGPTLSTQGIDAAQVLPDPVIELHDAVHQNVLIAINDNAGDNANADEIRVTATRIGAAPLRETDAASSALLLTLPTGVYSFIARGKTAASSGIVLVEVYDAD